VWNFGSQRTRRRPKGPKGQISLWCN
jgi:hypothetical protein